MAGKDLFATGRQWLGGICYLKVMVSLKGSFGLIAIALMVPGVKDSLPSSCRCVAEIFLPDPRYLLPHSEDRVVPDAQHNVFQ